MDAFGTGASYFRNRTGYSNEIGGRYPQQGQKQPKNQPGENDL
ncbi:MULTISPECIES: hypothetical protein [unclassified Microcystis]|nr:MULTISPECIES: hypothetical protein [unclassified Microcystis]